MTFLRTGALAAAVLLVVACGSGGTGSPTPGPTSLDGRTFLSTDLVGHDLVAGTQVRLALSDGRIAITAGCNSMSGPYRVADDRLVIGTMATTEMGCAEPLMAQDRWVGAFLGGATLGLAGDTLTLRNGEVTMTMTDRRIADPDRPLEGTRWILDGIVAGDTVSSVPAGVTAAITIADDRIAVETGCNTGGATVDVAATHLTIGPLALTRRACPPDVASVETAMTGVLTGEVAYAIDADQLTLTSGQSGLTFRAAS
jgi:heat shock protein HslJ